MIVAVWNGEQQLFYRIVVIGKLENYTTEAMVRQPAVFLVAEPR